MTTTTAVTRNQTSSGSAQKELPEFVRRMVTLRPANAAPRVYDTPQIRVTPPQDYTGIEEYVSFQRAKWSISDGLALAHGIAKYRLALEYRLEIFKMLKETHRESVYEKLHYFYFPYETRIDLLKEEKSNGLSVIEHFQLGEKLPEVIVGSIQEFGFQMNTSQFAKKLKQMKVDNEGVILILDALLQHYEKSSAYYWCCDIHSMIKQDWGLYPAQVIELAKTVGKNPKLLEKGEQTTRTITLAVNICLEHSDIKAVASISPKSAAQNLNQFPELGPDERLEMALIGINTNPQEVEDTIDLYHLDEPRRAKLSLAMAGLHRVHVIHQKKFNLTLEHRREVAELTLHCISPGAHAERLELPYDDYKDLAMKGAKESARIADCVTDFKLTEEDKRDVGIEAANTDPVQTSQLITQYALKEEEYRYKIAEASMKKNPKEVFALLHLYKLSPEHFEELRINYVN